MQYISTQYSNEYMSQLHKISTGHNKNEQQLISDMVLMFIAPFGLQLDG